MHQNKLVLLPNVISESDWKNVIPQNVRNEIVDIKKLVTEDIRTARRYMRKLGYEGDFSEIDFFVLNKHTKENEIVDFIQNNIQVEKIGMLSESGLPCIADPGNLLVEIARSFGFKIVPMTGPSSIFLSLMASGFNGQNFAFLGYLPIDKFERKKRLSEIEKLIIHHDQTQIFIETPYRNQQLFEAILQNCNSNLRLCIASNITDTNEKIEVKELSAWKKTKFDISKQNTIFLLYK